MVKAWGDAADDGCPPAAVSAVVAHEYRVGRVGAVLGINAEHGVKPAVAGEEGMFPDVGDRELVPEDVNRS